MKKAVLICNGLSSEGYTPPDDAYVVAMNGGFTKHRADAAFTCDCPSEFRQAWLEWGGKKVMASHNAMYPCKKSELFVCDADIRKYHSSTPAVLRWILKEGFTRCLIVGMDALYGLGKPGSEYSAEGHIQFLRILAPQFTDGLFVRHEGREVQIDDTFLRRLSNFCAASKSTAVPVKTKSGKTEYRPAVPVSKKCLIPQTMVEFDVSPKCTRSCSFCAPGIPKGRRKQKKGLKLSQHNKVIDQLAAVGFNQSERWICYCGHGEPLMNPKLFDMIRYTKSHLPACKVVVYTNGDLLTEEICCTLEALDIHTLIWDCYDQKTADKVPPMIANSSLDPERVRVNDYRAGFPHPSSRCSTVSTGKVAEWRNKPCEMPQGKIFLTDDTKGGTMWLLCCECYDRKQKWSGELSPKELNEDDGFKSILQSLARGGRDCCDACRRCDRDGGHPEGFHHVPKLDQSPFWPVAKALPKLDGKRLVIIPVNAKWSRHAKVVLDAIDSASTMPGKTLVLWNDDNVKNCPDFLRGETRQIVEYPGSLGWCGINVGISEAFERAIKDGYDYAIKMDTDTAILSKGWDAILCGECGLDSQLGTYMDASITGMLPIEAMEHIGLFTEQFERIPWARRFSKRGLRRWDHIQGGLYVVGVDALKRVKRVIGFETTEQANQHESQRIGEDVYFDTKCKISGVKQKDSQRLRIWFREPRFEKSLSPISIDCIRHQRDNCGVVAVHPVKDLGMLGSLAAEI